MRAGVTAVVGKPNVGKTTLMNFIVGQKVGIVSPKPQTTRKAILGIANLPGAQIVFKDTPGIHEPKTKLGAIMVERAKEVLSTADVILFVVDVSRPPNEEDRQIARLLNVHSSAPRVVALNKMDRLRPERVPEHYAAYEELTAPSEMMYTTALTGENVDKLIDRIVSRLPESEPLFDDPDLYTTQTVRDMAAELIREQVLLATRDEVPYGVAVVIESWEDADPASPKPITKIGAVIVVERKSHKPILIGKEGRMLKKIGTAARREIEDLVGTQVFLELFVKVREKWVDRPALLKEYGLF
ncbi:MAG: GTPase Era [Fimbriimonadales bacterium]|nr:MAG: GTPase Era [Fimbriimonadales bacterium]